MDGPSTVRTEMDIAKSLERIEAKLDVLIDSLAQEEEPETVEVVTMEGERLSLPADMDHL